MGATEAVYDGNPKGIEQPTTDISGIQIVTYYKQNPEDEFVSTDKFINAGHYYFKCEIVDSTYYGWVTGPFIIHKADPYITGLQVLDIIYESSMDSAVIRCQNTDPDWGDAYNFNYSSDRKVMGNFRITYPVPESMNYIRPSQGLKDITVTFTPTAEYYINYNEVSFQTTLYVEYSTNLEMVFVPETFEYTYKPDTKRYASVITYPGNQALIYEYKRGGRAGQRIHHQRTRGRGSIRSEGKDGPQPLQLRQHDNHRGHEPEVRNPQTAAFGGGRPGGGLLPKRLLTP